MHHITLFVQQLIMRQRMNILGLLESYLWAIEQLLELLKHVIVFSGTDTKQTYHLMFTE